MMDFKKCLAGAVNSGLLYDNLKYLHYGFAGVSVKALTATLDEKQLKLVCENYL